jgi:uncharacterized membrane protein
MGFGHGQDSTSSGLAAQNEVIILTDIVDAKMIDRRAESRSRILLPLLILLAIALRLFRLAEPLLSWDEGWSIGLATLSWSEIARITALDVHPPLYYFLFKFWLGLGRHAAWIRLFSVLAGVAVVPFAYATARLWSRTAGDREREECLGVLAAAIVTISPFLVYYSQVARMFSLCVALTLLATYCLLKALEAEHTTWYWYGAFVISAVAALYTFYYTAFAIAAALLYALVIRPRRWRPLLICALAMGLLYLPWLTYAVPAMLQRVGSRTGFAFGPLDALRFLADGVFGLVFAYGAGWPAVYLIVALLITAVVWSWQRRESTRLLLLPLLAIALTLVAVSIGARAHMFAARYVIPASPFLGLLMAWAIAVLWDRARAVGLLSLVLVVLAVLPTMVRYVYEKSYEVSGAFDPRADYRFLKERVAADDIVFYNVLSIAGHYEWQRTAADPPWSYVLRWDPVIEPLEPALDARVQRAAKEHRRLWFVLYKGTVAANLPLKEWLDRNLFPASGEWREDTLYLQYLSPRDNVARAEPGLMFEQSIELQAVAFSPQTAADDRVTVSLTWRSGRSIERSYKVFVHLYAADGRLVAQHDSVPVNELRPTWSWAPGEQIVDRHGLWVPEGISERLRLVVGLYDPETSVRLMLADGSDHAQIGMVEITSAAAQS